MYVFLSLSLSGNSGAKFLLFFVFWIAAHAHYPLQPVRISADEEIFFAREAQRLWGAHSPSRAAIAALANRREEDLYVSHLPMCDLIKFCWRCISVQVRREFVDAGIPLTVECSEKN
jgi:hypothetical protein